jgi:hypothetical protein
MFGRRSTRVSVWLERNVGHAGIRYAIMRGIEGEAASKQVLINYGATAMVPMLIAVALQGGDRHGLVKDIVVSIGTAADEPLRRVESWMRQRREELINSLWEAVKVGSEPLRLSDEDIARETGSVMRDLEQLTSEMRTLLVNGPKSIDSAVSISALGDQGQSVIPRGVESPYLRSPKPFEVGEHARASRESLAGIRMGSCVPCRGSGWIQVQVDCRICGGSGRVHMIGENLWIDGHAVRQGLVRSMAFDWERSDDIDTCPICEGTKKQKASIQCSDCHGTGGELGSFSR